MSKTSDSVTLHEFAICINRPGCIGICTVHVATSSRWCNVTITGAQSLIA